MGWIRFAAVLAAMLLRCDATETTFSVLRSTDGGQSWTEASGTFRTNRVNAMISDSSGLWAGTDRGLFKSFDGGINWMIGSDALKSERILDLVSNKGAVLVGTHSAGIWISSNGGGSWTQAARLPKVLSVAFDGRNFLAGLDRGEVHRSSDRGATWKNISEGLPAGCQVFQLAATPRGRVFAALYARGLYEYRGDRWTKLGTDRLPMPLGLFADDDTLIAGHNPGGIYRSTDNGGTWEPMTTNLPFNAPTWILRGFGKTIYYGTTGESGLYASTDKGVTWTPLAPHQLRRRAVIAIAANDRFLFAVTSDSAPAIGLMPSLFD